ncbi:hypothetical protein SSP531S_23830 [Streptomyces spongiicola]|uniref:Uncharacterized protein n=1 Tax=Streptomyces spongiicola TaxID=1690221 RepID=A0A388SWE3_9ACTN|nr:hypothetical protein SSP531S_23830 [Streptomyces spongiicola]
MPDPQVLAVVTVAEAVKADRRPSGPGHTAPDGWTSCRRPANRCDPTAGFGCGETTAETELLAV